MESRLACLLTVLSVAITVLVATGIAISPAFAAVVAVVSLLALAAWLTLSWRTSDGHGSIVGACLLGIVLFVVLATCRYLSQVVPVLAGPLMSLFAPGFPVTDSSWFVSFVVAPVTLMLLGSWFLARRSPLGLYMAWWTAFYVSADGVLQFAPALRQTSSTLAHLGSVLVALTQICVGVAIGRRLLNPVNAPENPAPTTPLTLRQRNLWTALFLSLVAVYAVALNRQAGPLPLAIVVGSMAGGLVGWRFTTALRPADPVWAVPMYLLLLTLFYVHVGDEALTSFNRGIAALSGKPWNDQDFTLLIGLAGPAVWFLGAWSLWKRQAFGNFIFWFFIVGMILGEPTHLLVFPVVAMHKFGIGYRYFSGMYTALFPMIPAILSLVTLVDEHRQGRQRVPA